MNLVVECSRVKMTSIRLQGRPERSVGSKKYRVLKAPIKSLHNIHYQTFDA